MTDHPDLSSAAPAASLIVFRHGPVAPELLMVRRADKLAFGGGATVFPGGRVDAGDHQLARDLPGDADWNAASIACIRETLEETGLLLGVTDRVDVRIATELRARLHAGEPFGALLDAHRLALDLDGFVPFARWYPPGRAIRRFDTRFLLFHIGTGDVTLSADGTETTAQFWASPPDLLAMGDRGEVRLMFPTRANIDRIARLGSFEAAKEDSLSRGVVPVTGEIVERDGRQWLMAKQGGYNDYAEPLETATRGVHDDRPEP